MNGIFEAALGVGAPWFVKGVDFNVESKRLDIELAFSKGSLFTWKGKAYKAYDTVEKEWRHLNFFEHECYLKARVPRVKTDDGGTHVVMPGWSGLQNGFTLLFEALILQLAKHMPVHQVALLTKSSDHVVWSILERYVDTVRQAADYSTVTQLGLDETSQAKGHDYITLFVDLLERRTIFVTEGKDSETVKAFKKDFEAHGGHPNAITDVSCDMSPAFIKGVTEELPGAEITFDKFHVLKCLNEAVDQVRREDAQSNPLLKRTRFLFLKNEKNLTAAQLAKKAELKLSKLNQTVFRALHIREAFQQIYTASSEQEFTLFLKKWYFWATHSRLEPIKKAARTIKKHWDGIVRWKVSQINNGILEGLNSVIQAAKRKARGYKFNHFKTIVYLITGKLNFTQINPHAYPLKI